MLSNPQIGQRVRCVSVYPYNGLGHHLVNKIGTIIHVSSLNISVQFDSEACLWYCYPEHLGSPELTPEEQDQKNRAAHADKYL